MQIKLLKTNFDITFNFTSFNYFKTQCCKKFNLNSIIFAVLGLEEKS